MFGGFEKIALRSGGAIRCGDYYVERTRASGAVERIELDEPSGGIGGVELVVSRDQRHAALFVYSGQSEQGYELFALEPALRHIGGLPYVYGMGMAPVFAPDSRTIAMVVRSEDRVRGTKKYAEDVLDRDDDDRIVIVDWAKIYVQRIAANASVSRPKQITVGTPLPRSTELDELTEWHIETYPTFTSTGRLIVTLPWTKVKVDIASTTPVTTPSPPR